MLLFHGPYMRSELTTEAPRKEHSIFLINLNRYNLFLIFIMIDLLMSHNNCIGLVLHIDPTIFKN